jgi:integrating conjugative element protein (TIGR03757 family)
MTEKPTGRLTRRLTRRQLHQRLLILAALPALSVLPVLARAQQLNPFAGISSVEVFCNSAMLIAPIDHPPFAQTIYRMDAIEQQMRAINAQLPKGGQAVARPWVMAHMAQIRQQVQPLVAGQVNAISMARYYRIDRLPAIVINARAVVYGVTGVGEAIARYQAHIQGSR